MLNVAYCIFFIFLLICSQHLLPFVTWGLFFRLPQSKSKIVPRWKRYLIVIVTQFLQAGVALLVSSLFHIQIFGSGRIEASLALWAFGFLILYVGILDPLEWRYTSAETKKKMIAVLPQNLRERLLWIPKTLSTAFSEEIVYRAAFFGLFYRLTANYWMAAICASWFFGHDHRSYGRFAAVSMFITGLALQWFVKVSGGLYLPIAIHFIHNMVALAYTIRERQEAPATSPESDESEAVSTAMSTR